MSGLTHLDSQGNARMVDVGGKVETKRIAVASGRIRMSQEALAAIRDGNVPKGDVLAAARIAGIQAAKRTSDLIPLCHVIALTRVEVHIELDTASYNVHVTAVAEAYDRTGVEMEALVAASVASLTIYDMLKGIDRAMLVGPTRLLEKSGGKSGGFRR